MNPASPNGAGLFHPHPTGGINKDFETLVCYHFSGKLEFHGFLLWPHAANTTAPLSSTKEKPHGCRAEARAKRHRSATGRAEQRQREEEPQGSSRATASRDGREHIYLREQKQSKGLAHTLCG